MCESQQNEKTVRETKINSESLKKTWSKDFNILYRIPTGTEVIMFVSDSKTGEIIWSNRFLRKDKELVFPPKYLLEVSRSKCGCDDEIMSFHLLRIHNTDLIYQVNAQDVLVYSRKEYVLNIQ